MLHVTGGDAAVERLRQSGITGYMLPWKDILHEGPVPAGIALQELREVRARFIEQQGWGAFEIVRQEMRRRDETLATFRQHEEVILWFERGPEMVRELLDRRVAVTEAEAALAGKAWSAFRSPDPAAIGEAVAELTPRLPHLAAALVRHLEEYPSLDDGLSRTERQILRAVADGRSALRELHHAAHHEKEVHTFLGDIVFAAHIERLGSAREPAIVPLAGGALRAPRRPEDEEGFWRSRVRLTDTGQSVLEGKVDWVKINGIDRWLGGVYLLGPTIAWRWNETKRQLQRTGYFE